ncbi:MAG: DUF2380 domain-containing protein [Bacteroidales bacterium]|nr:DUF2380 domain-containing protein [Bacteroidales bacterium]
MKNKIQSRTKISLLIAVCVFFVTLLSSCGLDEDGNVEYHHIFPRQFSSEFQAKGINVDDFTIAVTKKDHRGAGEGIQYNPTNWNAEWEKFLTENPNCDASECYSKAQQMAYDSDLAGKFDFYNYNTKKLSEATVAGNTALVATATNGILGFFGALGNFLIKLFGGFSIGSCIIAFLASVGSGFLGWFGMKVEHPVAVGAGFVVMIIGILLTIGVVYCMIIFIKWIIAVVIPAILGVLGNYSN